MKHLRLLVCLLLLNLSCSVIAQHELGLQAGGGFVVNRFARAWLLPPHRDLSAGIYYRYCSPQGIFSGLSILSEKQSRGFTENMLMQRVKIEMQYVQLQIVTGAQVGKKRKLLIGLGILGTSFRKGAITIGPTENLLIMKEYALGPLLLVGTKFSLSRRVAMTIDLRQTANLHNLFDKVQGNTYLDVCSLLNLGLGFRLGPLPKQL